MEQNEQRTIEERLKNLEELLGQTLASLGLVIHRGNGRLGYSIPKAGPKETWGALARIINEIQEMKDERKIVVPGLVVGGQ